MSGFGGFGGFGQNNNTQQNTGFGGFGQPANTNTGFGGAPTTNTGFGASNTTGGGLFGSSNTGGFGTSGGFGSGTTGAFGANKPGFGAPAATGGTSLFGGNTANAGTSSGFGGFGGSTNTASTGFGSNTGGGLFGANKTGFGATNTTTASPFGGAATNTTGFGASSGFGASAATLGGNVGNPEGTANPAFQPTTEKEPNTTTSNNYQSITVMPAYVKYSFEELRLADYAHGRQKANAGGTAGAFGQSTGFGGFSGAQPAASGFGGGTAGGSGLFGSTNTSSPFGTNTASTGFGRNTATSGGLFGAKPATGAFGGAPSTQTGGLFGSTPSTGFGANTGTTGFGASTTPSIFNTSATQNKPGGLFGSTPGTSTTPFGSTAGTTGFGSNTGTSGGLFGNTQAQQPAANPFGTAATQPASNPFGGFGSNAAPTSSIFGNAAAKPATGGLFGSTGTTTGGGLFGAQPAQNTTSAFGNAGAASTTGGLFAPKPATGGLFGSTPAATTNTGGGLFGGSTFGQNAPQQPQNTGGGLFGGLNQAKPSLFGGATGATGGPSLFGNAGAQQTSGPSLFGNIGQNQQQQQNQQAGSSLFGGGINTSQQYQQPQQTSFTTSINDLTAFGTSSMFSNLATPDISNPGPIATPLSSLSKQKKSAVLPMYKMNPASASTSRYATPQKRGFGFTYSTYGTPTSAATTPGTPGTFNASLLGGSLSQKLMKSVSTSSLRNSYNSSFNREDSILAPGAFSNSPGSRFNSTGSMKRLVINRGIRQDLFTPPTKDKEAGGTLKKRVSFDSSTVGGMNGAPNGTSSPLKQMQSTETVTSNGKEGFNRSSNRSTNGIGSQSNGAFASPEMEQVKNNQLSILPEGDEENFGPRKSDEIKTKDDQEPGDYWSIPSKEELRAMTPAQLKKVENFIVGRYGVGQVAFNAPVDITTVKNLDDLYGKVVELELRSATVYPNWMVSPEPGTALNVPSTITLENSWPRAARGRKVTPKDLEKHIVRLKRMKDTQFISYDNDTGLVKFTVEHFTTYEVEFSDEETDADGEVEPNFGESTLSAPPDTPTPKSRTPLRQEADQSFASTSEYTESDPEEDTFDFKKRKTFPGAFDHTSAIDDDAEMEDEYVNQQQSFLDNRSAGSLSDNVLGDSIDQDDVQGNELVRVESNEMAGSYPQPDDTVEPENDSQDFEEDVAAPTPGGLMRARLRAMQNSDSPLKQTLQVEQDDWADMLQRTVSPQKRDREQLKRMRDSVADGTGLDSPSKKLAPANRGRIVSDGRGFATSIDLMHSLFGESKSPMKMAPIPEKRSGFEWPYQKQSKTSNLDKSDLNDNDRNYHDSLKPSWAADGTFVYAAPAELKPTASRMKRQQEGIVVQTGLIFSENREVVFAKFSSETSPRALENQKKHTKIELQDGIPYAALSGPFKFSDFFGQKDPRDPAGLHEKLVWELAGVLFDPIEVPADLKDFPKALEFLRRDNLSAFWEKLVDQASSQGVAMSKSAEEKAIAALSGHRVPDACNHLLQGKDFHLATLVALLGSNDEMRKDIRAQLDDWQKARVLAEINQPIRAIYEILSGNVCVCDGAKAVSIEDRVDSFIISQRFGLDWRQAFGLRLWYAITSSDHLGKAVQKFAEDLQQDKETARPVAWYVEQNIKPLWDDQDLESRQDLLWGLLKLYANSKTDLESVIRPENSQLSPLNVRLSWQLSRALTSLEVISYGADAEDKADRLTLSFASQLTNEGNWLDAIFVLLHLCNAESRTKAIQDHLAHHAGSIGHSADSQTFATMLEYKIPEAWIWEAKALYMRSVQKDPRREVECLILAKSYDEAHLTFCKEVAPKAVIERDYTTLRKLLVGFEGREWSIRDWNLGGALYVDYLSLLDGEKSGKIDTSIVERLLGCLPAMLVDARHATFFETVAVQEISNVVAKIVTTRGNKTDLSRVLELPLTEDRFLKHTMDLSLGYYQMVFAGGR